MALAREAARQTMYVWMGWFVEFVTIQMGTTHRNAVKRPGRSQVYVQIMKHYCILPFSKFYPKPIKFKRIISVCIILPNLTVLDWEASNMHGSNYPTDICSEFNNSIQSKFSLVNGVWGSWTEGKCSKSCGGGTKLRMRSCYGRRYGGNKCVGASDDEVSCNKQPCPSNIYN